MSQANDTKPCPICGERIKTIAVKCRYCGEILDEDEAEARLPGRSAVENEAERWLVPTNVNGRAMLSGYLGLFALLLPFLGLLLAIGAIGSGIAAFEQLNRNPRHHGRGRAWFGIITGIISLLGNVVMVVWLLMITHR